MALLCADKIRLALLDYLLMLYLLLQLILREGSNLGFFEKKMAPFIWRF